MPFPLLLGLITSWTPLCSSQRRLTSPGMSLKSRKPPSLFQSGPSVKAKPAPSRSTWASRSTRSYSFRRSVFAPVLIRMLLALGRSDHFERRGSQHLRDPGRRARGAIGFDIAVVDVAADLGCDRSGDLGRTVGLEVHPPSGVVALEAVADVEVLLEVVAQREVQKRPLVGRQLHRR